jgi:hypothetical protein
MKTKTNLKAGRKAGGNLIIVVCLPAGSKKELWLISESTTQMFGSSPHEWPKATAGVEPTRTPKSSTSKKSPDRNPSVIVKSRRSWVRPCRR